MKKSVKKQRSTKNTGRRAVSPPKTFQLGDRVKILHATGWRGRIVELRGPLGPGGAQIYRVYLGRIPDPTYIEVRGDQLKLLPSKQTDKSKAG
jgi:hypothetical protein